MVPAGCSCTFFNFCCNFSVQEMAAPGELLASWGCGLDGLAWKPSVPPCAAAPDLWPPRSGQLDKIRVPVLPMVRCALCYLAAWAHEQQLSECRMHAHTRLRSASCRDMPVRLQSKPAGLSLTLSDTTLPQENCAKHHSACVNAKPRWKTQHQGTAAFPSLLSVLVPLLPRTPTVPLAVLAHSAVAHTHSSPA
jgi:hypothetical protein